MFAEKFEQTAGRRGDAPFLVHGERVVSWEATLDTVARTASLLERAGVAPGDRVVLGAGNSPTFCYLWIALRWLGAICVPLHGSASPSAARAMVDDCGARLVIGDAARLDPLVGSGALAGVDVVAFTDASSLESQVAALAPHDRVDSDPFAECNLLYTSGTTGAPKGVVASNTALLEGGRLLAEALALTEEDRLAVALPLFHTNPQVYAVMTAFATGGSVAILDRFSPSTFFADAARVGATGFTYVGTVLNRLLSAGVPVEGHQMRLCVGGGAPHEVWGAVEERFGVTVHELYGQTETGGWVSVNRVGHRRQGSVGTIRADMTVSVVDPQDRQLHPGQKGEIVIRPESPGVVFDGYHGRPELTLARWRNLWFHSGDAGYFDEDGFLYFAGRVDHVIRRGGENVVPADVEAVLAQHPQVIEVAVVGIADADLGQEIKAVVVAQEGFDAVELVTLCVDRLPSFAWPRLVEFRDTLPKTETEKILVSQLQQRLDSDVDVSAAVRALSTRTGLR